MSVEHHKKANQIELVECVFGRAFGVEWHIPMAEKREEGGGFFSALEHGAQRASRNPPDLARRPRVRDHFILH